MLFEGELHLFDLRSTFPKRRRKAWVKWLWGWKPWSCVPKLNKESPLNDIPQPEERGGYPTG
jgi:hypothetical protein